MQVSPRLPSFLLKVLIGLLFPKAATATPIALEASNAASHLAPRATHPVKCTVNYKFTFNEFQIQGKDNYKIGSQGSGLKKALQGCGALTAWSFKRTPKDEKFKWLAKGRLPIATEDCIVKKLRALTGDGGVTCA